MVMDSEHIKKRAFEPLKPRKISPLDHLRSQRAWNLERLGKAFLRPKGKRSFDFITVGTSSKRPEELLELLKLPIFSCDYLVDIRNNPNSMHTPYWNKNNISKLCEAKGICYIHKPNLGVPSSIRKLLFSGQMNYEQFFSWYDESVLTQENMQQVVDLVRTSNVSFMCTELGPTYCHRHRVALRLEKSFGYISYDL
jgi:uncharacterized protein (DUF488 family)